MKLSPRSMCCLCGQKKHTPKKKKYNLLPNLLSSPHHMIQSLYSSLHHMIRSLYKLWVKELLKQLGNSFVTKWNECPMTWINNDALSLHEYICIGKNANSRYLIANLILAFGNSTWCELWGCACQWKMSCYKTYLTFCSQLWLSSPGLTSTSHSCFSLWERRES